MSNASNAVALNAAMNAVAGGKIPVYTDLEVALVKSIAGSVFANDEGAVPCYVLRMDLPEGLDSNGVSGLLSSLNKKGALVTEKIKGGMKVVKLSLIGKSLASK